ncbi:ABC transporter substrate-binding protein, partial [Bacteroides thetaiotaomicron]|nr:ABC transporter substrate-binding protein [Bacteroides thetaiotaomicron]
MHFTIRCLSAGNRFRNLPGSRAARVRVTEDLPPMNRSSAPAR